MSIINYFSNLAIFNPRPSEPIIRDILLETLSNHLDDTEQLQFKVHRIQYNPVLEQLMDKTARLAQKDIVIKDLINLFTPPHNLNKRLEFYNQVDPKFEGSTIAEQYIEVYNALVDKPNSIVALKRTSDAFNRGDLTDLIRQAAGTKLEDSVHLPSAVESFSIQLTKLTELQLDTLQVIFTLEPYMIFVLGQAVFVHLFIPLHEEGALKYFLQRCIERAEDIRNPFTQRAISAAFKKFVKNVNCHYKKAGYAAITTIIISLTSSVVMTILNTSDRAGPPATGAFISAVKSIYSGSRGLGYKPLQDAREFVNSVLFELGFTISSLSESFVRGFTFKYEAFMLKMAEYADVNKLYANNWLKLFL